MASSPAIPLPQWPSANGSIRAETQPAPFRTPAGQCHPHVVLDLYRACNQTCVYCVSGSSPQHDFGPFTDPDHRANLTRFFTLHGPFQILLTGGEPLLAPGLGPFLQELTALGHRVAIQSNLKSRAGLLTVLDHLPPDDCPYLLTTFHSVEIRRWPRYLGHVQRLRDAGYRIAVKLVIDEPMLERFAEFFDELVDRGIGAVLAPLMLFPTGQPPEAMKYTADDWAELATRITMNSAWLAFASGFHSRGTACHAGSDLLFPQTHADGQIAGCCHGFPTRLGSLTTGQLTPEPHAVACGLDRCTCDYHYYSGFIPTLDDSDRWERLIRGDNTIVPFGEYLNWIDAAGVRTVNDLREVLNDHTVAYGAAG
ncbi:MAG: radical SAM protein [Planctomycetota bacterium]